MSSAQYRPMFLNQSPTTRPHCPYAAYAVFNGMTTFRGECAGLASTTLPFTFDGSSTLLYGVSASDFPAYLFSSGLTSNDSTCDTPPHRKIQIMLFARGAKCARPSGGAHAAATPC